MNKSALKLIEKLIRERNEARAALVKIHETSKCLVTCPQCGVTFKVMDKKK